MPEQDDIGGQKAQEDPRTDHDLFLQESVTGTQKEKIGTGGHEFQWADRNDHGRHDVCTYRPIGKRHDQCYPPSTSCYPITHHEQTRPVQAKENYGDQQADYGPDDVSFRGEMADDRIKIVYQHIGTGRQGGRRIRNKGQCEDPNGNNERLRINQVPWPSRVGQPE